jgi:2-polyprenyl-6-methoxyphenol hydroxylase-like FAD-dependent oxidoreductase
VVGVSGRDQAGEPVRLDARFVVGADGLGSRVARCVAAAVVEDRGDHGATQYAYFAGLPWQGFEFFAGERSLAGVFPTNDGQACVWVCTPSQAAREARRQAASREDAFGDLLRHAAPRLADRLRAARRTSPVRGMLRTPNQRGEVDDATALTGYQRQRDLALREIFELTCAMAAYPPVGEFVVLQKQISTAIETEAAALAARPVPGERPLVRA